MSKWGVFRQSRVREVAITHDTLGKNPVKSCLKLESEFGLHDNRDEAVRALVSTYYPENKDDDITHIKRISKEFLKGSLGHYRILKLKNKD